MSIGLAGIPLAPTPTQRKDFVSDQEVRRCPGCGDAAYTAPVGPTEEIRVDRGAAGS